MKIWWTGIKHWIQIFLKFESNTISHKKDSFHHMYLRVGLAIILDKLHLRSSHKRLNNFVLWGVITNYFHNALLLHCSFFQSGTWWSIWAQMKGLPQNPQVPTRWERKKHTTSVRHLIEERQTEQERDFFPVCAVLVKDQFSSSSSLSRQVCISLRRVPVGSRDSTSSRDGTPVL